MRRALPILILLTLAGLALLWAALDGEGSRPAQRPARVTRESAADDARDQEARAVVPSSTPRIEDPPTTRSAASEGPYARDEVLEEADLPPDPVERGPGRLLLRLRTAQRLEPLASHVELWRLAAPGNAHWTEGDQLQDAAFVPEAGHTFTGLPLGAYRCVVYAQRSGAEAPTPFEVRADGRVELLVELPAERGAWLRVFDERGTELFEARLSRPEFGAREPERAWLQTRALRDPGLYAMEEFTSSSSGGSYTGLRASGTRGFDIGPAREPPQGGPWRSGCLVSFAGRSQVRVTFPQAWAGERAELGGDDAVEDLHFVGVAVRLEALTEQVLLPDGRRAVDAGGELTVTCDARPCAAGEAPALWPELPVHLRVTAPGFETLAFDWRPSLGALPTYVLAPAGR